MPTYKVTDPDSGVTLQLTGDSPPTEAELIELFAQYGSGTEGQQPAAAPMSHTDLLVANVKETAKGVGRGLLGIADLIPMAANAVASVLDESTKYSPFGVIYEQLTGEKADIIPDWLRAMPATDAVSFATGIDTRAALAQDKSVQIPGAPDPAFMGTVAEYMTGGTATAAGAQKFAQGLNTVPGTSAVSLDPTRFASQLARDASFVPREAALSAAVGVPAAYVREQGGSPVAEAGTALATGVGLAALPGLPRGVANYMSSALNPERVVEGQVGETLMRTVDDLDALVTTANNNRQQLIDAGVIQRGDQVNTVALTENPELLFAVQQLAKSDNALTSTINDMSNYLDTQLAQGVEGLVSPSARGAAGGGRVVTAVTDRIKGAQERFTTFVDSTTARLDEMRQTYADGVIPSEQGKVFSRQINEAFDTAKKTEKEIWRNVDEMELQVDTNGLSGAIDDWFSVQKSKPFFEGTVPTEALKPLRVFQNNPTSENYTILMSGLREAKAKAYNTGDFQKKALIEEIFDLVDGQVTRMSDDVSYQEAVAFTRNIYKTFDPEKFGRYIDTTAQGNLKIDPEVTLTQLIRPGADVGDVRRLIELDQSGMGGEATKGALKTVEDAFYQMFGRAENKQKFLSEYGDLLDKFPTMAVNLQRHADEIDRMAEAAARAEGRAANLQDKNKVAVAVFLGADPDNLVPVLQKINSKELPKMVSFFERAGLAEEFQGIYLDRLSRRIIEGSGEGVKKFNLDEVLKQDNVLRAGWSNVLTPKQKEYLRLMERFSKMENARVPFSAAAGRPYMDLQAASPLHRMAARMMAVRMSSVAVPSGPGSIQSAAIAANYAQRMVNGLQREQVTTIIDKMLRDPEYFERVLRRANVAKTIDEKVRTFGVGMGVAAERPVEEETRPRPPLRAAAARPTPPPQPQPGMLTGM